MSTVQFMVYSDPVPKGSTKAFVVNGRACTTNANSKTKAWETLVATVAQEHRPEELWRGPVAVALRFIVSKPKTVKRGYPSVKPDIDKLARAVLDGLTGIVFQDDAQVIDLEVRKRYGDSPGVSVLVWEVK